LIQGIADGNLALPEFQRDFDWTDDQVASLNRRPGGEPDRDAD
jgi:uncharacterized protein with ParB-like and HNH nuclease domain